MSTKTHSTSIAALVLLALNASTAPILAQERSTLTTTAAIKVGSPASRIRCLDREARQVVERAVASSPTVARMVAELEQSDLIVGVQLCPLAKTLLGEARVVMATPDVRYVRIRIKIPNAMDELISVLGHELQHARELASAPEVRDAAGQEQLYRRIGYERHSGGFFETTAALDAGRTVAAEIRRASLR